MRYFYNPETQERVNENTLALQYSVSPDNAAEAGFYPLQIVMPVHRFYSYRDDGVEQIGETNTYQIKWQQVPNNLDAMKNSLKSDLAAIRYEKEISGIKIDTSEIRTDRESQATITGGWAKAKNDPDVVINFKGVNGWVQLNSAAMVAIGDAVFSHVQACFNNEKAISDLIDAAESVEDLMTINLNEGWPNQAE